MIFDESSDLRSPEMKDNDDLDELLKIQNNEASHNENAADSEFDDVDPSPSVKVKEDDQPTLGPGSSCEANQEKTHPPEKDDYEGGEEQMDQPQSLASKPGWKHS